MTGLWLPLGKGILSYNSVTVPAEVFYRRRTWLVGVCKCGHMWIMHFHNNNPNRPGTSCDEWNCKCKHYRFRRLRDLNKRWRCRIEDGYCLTHHTSGCSRVVR